MSFYTGTQMELLFSGPPANYPAAAAAVSTIQNTMTGASADFVQPYLPAFFWQMGRQNQAIHATFFGIVTGQASATNMTLTAQLCTASNTTTTGTGGGTLVASTATVVTSLSNQPWQFDVFTLSRGAGYGTSATSTNLLSFGDLQVSGLAAFLPSPITGPTSLTTIDASATWWYNLAVTFSTASATNSCTLEMVILRGMN